MKRRLFIIAAAWIAATVAAVVAFLPAPPTPESGPDLAALAQIIGASGAIFGGLFAIWQAVTVWQERSDARKLEARLLRGSVVVDDAGFTCDNGTLTLRVWLRNAGHEPVMNIRATVRSKASRDGSESEASTEGSLASLPVGPSTVEIRVPLRPFQRPALDPFGGLIRRGQFLAEPWLSIRMSFEGASGLVSTRSFSLEGAATGPVIAD